MTTYSTPQRISGPEELLQAIPYLLGFHPSESLVLVGLANGLLAVTARLDLADVRCPQTGAGVVEHTLAAMSRGGSTSVLAVVYGTALESPARPEVDASALAVASTIDEAARVADCPIWDVLLVAGGRWWSLQCDSAQCCPPDGRPLPSGTSPFAAAAAFEGVVALPDRAALERTLDPLPGREALTSAVEDAEHEVVTAILRGHGQRHERSVKRALYAAARDSESIDWTGVDDAEVARLGCALGEPHIRDSMWMAIDGGRLDGRPLWRDLARRLPSPYDAPALFLFGWATWRAGDGALAGIAAERAVASDPRYSAADLLLAALAHGVDPRSMPRLRQSRPSRTLRRSA